MRTIPRNISRPVMAGERRVTCDLCGMQWMRSDCIRDMDGFIRCPDDQDGLSNVELARENASGAMDRPRHPVGGDW